MDLSADGKGKSISPIRLEDALSGPPTRNTSMIGPPRNVEISDSKKGGTPDRSRKSSNPKSYKLN